MQRNEKTEVVRLRATPEECSRLTAFAARKGVKVSELVRRAVNAAARAAGRADVFRA